jgi:isoleucyl-tRNA synthetase
MRKSSGFDVTDRIDIAISSPDKLIAAVRRHDEFIRKETLAETIKYVDDMPFEGSTEWNINGVRAALAVVKR